MCHSSSFCRQDCRIYSSIIDLLNINTAAARDQPGIYLKVLALLMPRQDKLEHTNTIKTMTDEELESAIGFLHEMMAAQAVESAHLVEMKAEPAALPAPGGQSPEKLSSKRKPNRLMLETDTAVGPRERTPRKREGGEDE